MQTVRGCLAGALLALYGAPAQAQTTTYAGAEGLVPPLEALHRDHPRVFLRPAGTTGPAVTLDELKARARGAEGEQMLKQLRGAPSAAAQAMVWRLTGDKSAADAAVARMRGLRTEGGADSFRVYFGLRELALAYDWLHDYEGFPPAIRAEVRANAAPLVSAGLRISNDHIFHNYVWQSAGGVALWTLAAAGEDAAVDAAYAVIRERLNARLLPAMRYLDGAPGESMWYWSLYDLSPAALAVLAAQSASGRDLVGEIRSRQGDWLARQFEHTMVCTFPDLSYTPFGDTKAGSAGATAGPDGGVTHEMAGVLRGLTWALQSGAGAWFDDWIAGKRGARRFYGETGVFYFLYAPPAGVAPVVPPLAVLAGGRHGGHAVSRSGWDDGATVVAFRATDHFGSHNHFDQGSFIIYRRGMLAIDQTEYRKVGGPQQATETHNTLLIGGHGQRRVVGQSFRTLEEFRSNLDAGLRLETGDMPFYRDTPEWTAAAAEFSRAYPDGVAVACMRQILFLRPGVVAVVDRLAAPPGRKLGEVRWLLHVPAGAAWEGRALVAGHGRNFLRCRQLLPGGTVPVVDAALTPSCERAAYAVEGGETLTLAHVLEVGDGPPPSVPLPAEARQEGDAVRVRLGDRVFTFGGLAAPEISAAAPDAR